MSDHVRVDGKFFALARDRFEFRGVTYGTFAPRADGSRFREREQVKLDFASMRESGFSVVRTYTMPPDDVVDLAADWGLHLLVDVFYPDWRYLVGSSRRQRRRVAREARAEVRHAVSRFQGNEQILALSLGNEVPADVVRWLGTTVVAETIAELADVVREHDPEQIVTYANYPTAEYLPLEALDFLMFNVFLENRDDFRRYLTRLHHLAGERPLVLGEVGSPAGTDRSGEQRHADAIEWQLETAIERGVAGTCVFSWTDEWWVGDGPVEGWPFGLTRTDRSPRPALDVAARANDRTVRDLAFPWPSMTVVVCAYNAESTLDECLGHTCDLDYPDLEILVIDDGSTDATAQIASRHPRARLVSIPHAGLGAARNEGLRQARGELVAYLDSDAYPSAEWPYYLALGLDRQTVGAVGGPNVPPADDPVGAQVVARAPGGPVHVLLSDDRAEHVPGCNMAFWKQVLTEVGGFDPIYTAAGDDVDVCWKILDRNWEIGFHPAALVWHHRRPGLRGYLRQQRGYGRSEALVEARHPDRFTPSGAARWRGRLYNPLTPPVKRQRIYRGLYGAAAYQSVYQAGGYVLDLVHQIGVPLAAAMLLTLPLALLSPWLAVPAALGAAGLGAIGTLDALRTDPPRGTRKRRLRFRLSVALHHLLQPLVRTWERSRHQRSARNGLPPHDPLPGPVRQVAHGIFLVPEDRPRADLAIAVIDELRRTGVRTIAASGWEDYDTRLLASAFVYGDLQTSSHPVGFVQLRVRPRLRSLRLSAAAVAVAIVFVLSPGLGPELIVFDTLDALVVAPIIGETGRGLVRTRFLLRRALTSRAADAGG